MRAMQIVATASTAFILAVSITMSPAFATRNTPIGGTYSRATIKKDCAGVAGGSYYESAGHYGCINMNSGAVVDCVKGKCGGRTSARMKPPHTLAGLLHPPHAGNKDSGSNPPPRRGLHPVKLGGLAKTFGRSTGPTNPNGSLMIKHHFRH